MSEPAKDTGAVAPGTEADAATSDETAPPEPERRYGVPVTTSRGPANHPGRT